MARRAAPHRGIDVHYGEAEEGGYAADSRPSKTRMKQQSHDLQALGLQIAELSADKLAAIDLPEALRDAIEELRRTRSFEGKRRQLQYVGKLMRNADEEALREAVAAATVGSAKETLLMHETERWRAELIADDEAMTRWLQQFPDTDSQEMRSLVRAARRDSKDLAPEARQPKSFRELFQAIKPHLVALAAASKAQDTNAA